MPSANNTVRPDQLMETNELLAAMFSAAGANQLISSASGSMAPTTSMASSSNAGPRNVPIDPRLHVPAMQKQPQYQPVAQYAPMLYTTAPQPVTFTPNLFSGQVLMQAPPPPQQMFCGPTFTQQNNFMMMGYQHMRPYQQAAPPVVNPAQLALRRDSKPLISPVATRRFSLTIPDLLNPKSPKTPEIPNEGQLPTPAKTESKKRKRPPQNKQLKTHDYVPILPAPGAKAKRLAPKRKATRQTPDNDEQFYDDHGTDVSWEEPMAQRLKKRKITKRGATQPTMSNDPNIPHPIKASQTPPPFPPVDKNFKAASTTHQRNQLPTPPQTSESPEPNGFKAGGAQSRNLTKTEIQAQVAYENRVLLEGRARGITFSKIKQMYNLDHVAEATLRTRFRTLTKAPEHRLRDPQWQPLDVKCPHSVFSFLVHGGTRS
jgi:hypothetical protein